VYDPSKPHNEALKENCCYVLPFARGMDDFALENVKEHL
jgi:hypothetical protein